VPPESIWEITHTPKRGNFLTASVNPFQERTLFFTVEFATLLVLNHLISALYGKLFRFAPQKLGQVFTIDAGRPFAQIAVFRLKRLNRHVTIMTSANTSIDPYKDSVHILY
jgi:hypothetical protein